MAKLSSVSVPTAGTTINSQTMYSGTVQIGNSVRASALAPNYQQYRVDYVEVRIKPLFDTFVNGITASSAPNLYFYINKSGSPITGLTDMKSMGLNPKPFAKDGDIVYRFKPSAILSTDSKGSSADYLGPTLRKNSPWLNTNNNPYTLSGFAIDNTTHWGYNLYIEVAQGATATAVATLEVETHFSFRYPLSSTPPGETRVQPTLLSC